MDAIPLSALYGALVLLLGLSAFFSGSETGLMTLNRYRLRHLVRGKHRGAMRAQALLDRPDRLIGMILVGNNLVNILITQIATLIALRQLGENGLWVATVLLTLVILLFAEVTPKTLAALHPERIAFPAAHIYTPLQHIMWPIVWGVSLIANGLLRLLGVQREGSSSQALSREELRTVLLEAGAMIPKRHQKMLLNLLDLEQVTVEDIMIPRNEVLGIDLNDEWTDIEQQIMTLQYTRLPVYRDSIDEVIGFAHLRDLLPALRKGELDEDKLLALVREPLFVPENTSLNQQLRNFQRSRQRVGLVVNEYGDLQGLVTLEDILEEIVGEFTTDPIESIKDYTPQEDGSYLVDGTATVRDLNRALRMDLPTQGPKTLNGLILEHMEDIPEPGTSLLLAGYPVEIVQIKDNLVKTARLQPVKHHTATDKKEEES
ncbi:MAG: HlyC/CorC family transporter [Gammaproteobacteria bacterium]|nr:HlyC/CorC family transporter [Gammaproteobacteria bacterium]